MLDGSLRIRMTAQSAEQAPPLNRTTRQPQRFRTAVAIAVVLALCANTGVAATVYKWVDEQGVVHLSIDKPPKGVKHEQISVASTPGRTSATLPSGASAGSRATSASPAQVAERSKILSSLGNRECVIALESLDRMTSGSQPTSAAEIRRVQQTADRNCSADPATRQQQEAMAARLRVANSPSCVQARNLLADMLDGGAGFTREQVRLQQQFVDEHCTSPVR